MNRRLVLEAVKHRPPPAAVRRSDGLFDLTLNLKDVFHHGYIEVHDRPPAPGTNPFLDEYAPLLEQDTDLLKWSQGIARGDHKNSESQKLGRIFARAYLALQGYRWFPDIKDLLHTPERGWSARRPDAGGNMPDWLVGDSDKAAVAEAKGTHSAICESSAVLDRLWRPQIKNVEVLRNGTSVTLKGWIVATRWVTSRQKHTGPKIYAEDPEASGREPLGSNDMLSLNIWLARAHTLRNLRRLARHQLAQRVGVVGIAREGVPVARPMTWRCAASGLEKIAFIGRPIGQLPGPMPWFSLDWRFVREFFPFPIDRADWERCARLWAAAIDDVLETTWFDGVALPVVTALVHDELPSTFQELRVLPAEHFDVSLLEDGSFLAPMSLMKPGERVEI